ncbi:DUF624 domain-containing protein [Gracilibacillus alcaliphilus]|uniref:DUF624 domain-containing protein n=1 Tax=Gracilibacillus alcaliphilus TaxID=1401441 RepID=UPI0030841B07
MLWLFLNLPILFFALSLLAMDKPDEVYTILLTIIVLAPFIFFPATAALFGVIRKMVMKQEVPLLRSFFTYYKENYLRSLLGGGMIILLWGVLLYYYLLLGTTNMFFTILFLLVAVSLFVFTLHFFSITVHMEIKLIATWKSAFFLTIGAPLFTIGIGAVGLLIIYISLYVFTFFIPFFMMSILAYLALSVYYKLMLNFEAARETAALHSVAATAK